MGMYRKFTRWKMVTLNCLSHHPCLFCVLLGAFLLTLSYVNNRVNQFVLDGHTLKVDAFKFQEQLRQRHKNAQRTKTTKECEIFSLQPNTDRVQNSEFTKTSCKRIPPVPGSCDLADQIFFSKPQATCSHQKMFNFCELKRSLDGKWKVLCNETQSRHCLSPLSVGKINKITGVLYWEESGTPLKTSEMLTSIVQTSSLTDASKHYGFCFIRCLTKYPALSIEAGDFYNPDSNFYDHDEEIYAEQLLILPPQLKPSYSEVKHSSKYNISINIVLVDSVSHQHFFRSLPESVSALRDITLSQGSGTTVLDFQLVQAVRSRTFETLQAMFSGHIDPSEKPFGTQEIPPQPLNLSFLLQKFKHKGYQTLWVEDLCYLWEWGISKDLHFLNKSSSNKDTWVRMWKTLSENYVDSVEVTLAMCKVLEVNNVADHFHGPDSVCFNGRHQHEYLLEYIKLYQQTLESRKLPYFAFTMTNVAHEDSGKRVQTLDKALAKYLKFTATLENTLTVVFSDHGNAYGSFMHATQEARIELFHPFMIFVIPKSVARILGDHAMRSLNVNTLHLVSILDLHFTLNHIIDPNDSSIRATKGQIKVSRKGLFESVNVNRTCDDIPRIMPNLCICQDYDTPIANDTNYNLFAYFAIGRLNDEIQRQLLLSQKKRVTLKSNDGVAAFKKCQKLVLMSVQNVRKSFGQDRTETLKMDLHVQQSQVFFVAVSIKHNSHDQGDHKTELEMFDRITPYSMFFVCADDINLSLCICDIAKTSTDSVPEFNIPQEKDFKHMNLLPHFEVFVQNIDSSEGCICIVTIKHAHGAVIFSANSCRVKSFILTAALEADDEIIYCSLPRLPVVLPGGMVVLGLLYTETDDSWSSSVRVSFQVVSDLHEFRLETS